MPPITPDHIRSTRWLAVCVAVLGLCLSGCWDDVDKTYDTAADARDDGLFDSGLLPDILPPSAYDIRIISHTDANQVQGEFSFDPADYAYLTARFESFYQPFEYSADGHTWQFYFDPAGGHCYYFMR